MTTEPLPPPQASPWLDQLLADPDGVYTREVQSAIIDSMIKNSVTLNIGPDDTLLVSARDNAQPDPRLPSSSLEFQTLLYRIKGSDLKDFHDGRLTLEEARKRVTVSG